MTGSCPDPSDLPHRQGRWLYGGIGFHHFGHALIFSTARLWALDHLDHSPDGIVFIDRGVGNQTRVGTTRHLQAQLDFLGVELPVWTISQPEVVETLLVPDQGISTHASLFRGTDRYRQYIRRIIDKKAATSLYGDVYVSRRKLGFHKAGLMFEDRIQEGFAKAGYHIFHPQDHTLDHQINVYKSARRIVTVDGSALHLVAFAAQKDTRIGILSRRGFYADAFIDQIKAFSEAEAVAMKVYDTAYAPRSSFQDRSFEFKALCQTDFDRLAHQLITNGFLAENPGWKNPPLKRILKRLERAGQKGRDTYAEIENPS
nr:glycosyltransferase 61 family protein [Pseudaestuariivita rosea]